MNRSTSLQAVANGPVAAAPPKTIFDLMDNDRFKSGLSAVAGSFLTADRMLRLVVNAIKRTPKLMECSPQSMLGAVMTSAALGLEPNTIQQQAFLIPFKGRAKRGDKWVDVYEVQFQIGARGFVTLAHRAGVRMIADAIHQFDIFDHEVGSETFLRFKKNLQQRGELIGSFSHAKFSEGETVCVLPLEELLKIRGRSETYRALEGAVRIAESDTDRAKAQKKLDETPWSMWADDMVAKSALKKHAKQLPIAANDLQAAADIDSGVDANVIDMAEMADPDIVRAVVRDGMPPPALANDPGESANFGGEAFGIRENESVDRDGEISAGASNEGKKAEVVDKKPGFTVDQVDAAIKSAATLDALDEAASLISSVGNTSQQKALNASYAARRAALGGD